MRERAKLFFPLPFPSPARVEPLYFLQSSFQTRTALIEDTHGIEKEKKTLLPSVISTLILSWEYLLSLSISTHALKPLPVTSSAITGLSCKSLLYGEKMGAITHPYKLKTALLCLPFTAHLNFIDAGIGTGGGKYYIPFWDKPFSKELINLNGGHSEDAFKDKRIKWSLFSVTKNTFHLCFTAYFLHFFSTLPFMMSSLILIYYMNLQLLVVLLCIKG